MKKIRSKISLKLSELAQKVDAQLEGNGDIVIKDVSPIETAQSGEISFVANLAYLEHIANSDASALVLSPEITISRDIPVLRHKNPYLTFSKIVDIFYPVEKKLRPGTDSSAVVASETEIAESAAVGPLCNIGEGTKIGNNSQLISSVYIGKNVIIGDNCLIYPGVVIIDDSEIGNNVIIHASTVIGSDGFGYAESESGLQKIQQIGWVKIEDDVEIGSNVSIDRGALGATLIGEATKIDNLVQVGHNVQIGKHSIIISQVGISGSTTIGNQVILAGQVGVAGHIKIGDGAKVGGQSGITKSIDGNKKYMGTPAVDFMESARMEASLRKLPKLLKRVKKLEKKNQ